MILWKEVGFWEGDNIRKKRKERLAIKFSNKGGEMNYKEFLIG